MGSRPKISVIIPAYNCGRYLPEALDSVLAQTLKDFEVIVIDDGSEDNTEDVLERYKSKILYLRGPNGGASAARNRGLRLASGELIAFLDADDRWYPNKLARQVQLLERCPEIGVCYSNFDYFDASCPWSNGFAERNSALLGYPRREIGPGIYLIMSPSLLEDFLRRQAFPKPSTTIVRRRCFDVVGEFDEAQRICEDTQMYLRLSKHFSYGYVDEILAGRRVRDDTLASSADARGYTAVHIQMLRNLKGCIELTPAERSALRGAIAQYHFVAGYLDFDEYKLVSSRRHFWESLKVQLRVSTGVYLWLTLIPKPAIRLLRLAKQQLS